MTAHPASALGPRFCRLHSAIGHVEACPEEGCAFWEPGGAVLEGRCAFERLDVSGRPELAAWLLRVRALLEAAGTVEEEAAARRLFRRVLTERRGS